MKYCRHEHITSDTRELKDAEIFVAYKKDQTWAFGMKIRGMFTFTGFRLPTADKDEVKRAMKQIMFCKKYGWSYLGKKAMNPDSYEMEPEFMCMYCHGSTFDSSKPCVCRNTTIEDMIRKTPSGIVLPY